MSKLSRLLSFARSSMQSFQLKSIEKPASNTHIRGQDPRPYLAGRTPGLWASNHLEEANQLKGWQFVSVRTLAKMGAQSELQIARLEDEDERVERVERSLARAMRKGRRRSAKYCRLELERIEQERKWRKSAGATAASVLTDRHPVSERDRLRKLMTRPNPEWSWATFAFAAVQQICTTATALVWRVNNEVGAPAELYILPTGLSTPRLPTPEFPFGSWWLTPLSAWGLAAHSGWTPGAMGTALLVGAEIDARDVKPIRWPHPIYLADGLSPLSAGDMWVDLSNETIRAAWYAMENAERPGMIFERDPEVQPSEEELNQWREDLRAESAGTPNTGRHLMPPPGIKAAPRSMTPQELEYIESLPVLRDMSLALQGVTAPAAGVAAAGGYSEFWASVKQTTELSAQPMMDLIAAELTHFLGMAWEGRRYEISCKCKGIDDPQVLEQRLRTDIQAGNAVTVDEYRAMRKLKPFGGEKGAAFVGMQRRETKTESVDEWGDDKDSMSDDSSSKDDTGIDRPDRDAKPGRSDRNGKSAKRKNFRDRFSTNGAH